MKNHPLANRVIVLVAGGIALLACSNGGAVTDVGPSDTGSMPDIVSDAATDLGATDSGTQDVPATDSLADAVVAIDSGVQDVPATDSLADAVGATDVARYPIDVPSVDVMTTPGGENGATFQVAIGQSHGLGSDRISLVSAIVSVPPVDYYGGGVPTGCTASIVGSCRVIVCTPPSDAGPDASVDASTADADYPNSGEIDFETPLLATPWVITPAMWGLYYMNIEMGNRIWFDGDPIVIQGAGMIGPLMPGLAPVPAFVHTVIAPPTVAMSQPAEPPYSDATLDRANDWPLAWAAVGDAGSSTAVLRAVVNDTAMPYHVILCEFPVSAMSGSVPAALLQQLSPGMGAFDAFTASDQVEDRAVWRIRTTAEMFAHALTLTIQ